MENYSCVAFYERMQFTLMDEVTCCTNATWQRRVERPPNCKTSYCPCSRKSFVFSFLSVSCLDYS